MSNEKILEKYLHEIKKHLKDIDIDKREVILSDVKENISERFQDQRKDINIELLIDKYGDPEDVAMNYKMHFVDTKIKTSRKKQSIIIISLISLTILIAVILFLFFFSFGDGNSDRMEKGKIYLGKGILEIQIENSINNVYTEFGDPDTRVDTESTIWLVYWDDYGMDILISNYSKKVIEIRFNEAFPGEMEDGITVGDDLNIAFDVISRPKEIFDGNYSVTHQSLYGDDRVLYRQIGDDGNVSAYKYSDNRNGVIFWADENQIITQIVIIKPVG